MARSGCSRGVQRGSKRQPADGRLVVSVVLFSLGWILFGLASLRARVFPRALSVAVVIGGLIGFQAAMPPWGVALGLAVAAVGVWLIRQARVVQPVPAHPVPERIAVAE